MSEPDPISKPPASIPVDVVTLIVGASVVVAVLATGVALSYSGMKSEAIVALLTGLSAIVGTLVAILSKLATVHRVNAGQDQRLQKIEVQTNGAIRDTVRAEVRAALDARFGPASGSEGSDGTGERAVG
jgi:hypothetical protein